MHLFADFCLIAMVPASLASSRVSETLNALECQGCWGLSASRRMGFTGHGVRLPTSSPSHRPHAEAQWYTQALDHFSAHPEAASTTWKQRFCALTNRDIFCAQNSDSHITRWRLFWKLDVNDTLWGGPGFPIFLYIGGEGPESGGAVSGELFISRLAEEHQALLVDLEHRFYGESHPTADMSDDNLKYLTSLQALEDLSGCAFLSSLEMFLCSARHGCAACLYPAMLCCTCKALLAGLAQDGVINQELAQAHGSALAAATPVTYRPGSD